MTSISDFSNSPKYKIKDVSDQTGIRPVTLRAWERRYAVLSPSRSDNRYRLYSDRDIAVLRWLKSRTYSGVSISAAVEELRLSMEHGKMPEVLPISPAIQPVKASNPPGRYARELYRALLRYDEPDASDLLREALSVFDLRTFLGEVITPCLVDIGTAWYRGEIRITTEHFASSFIQGKLSTLLQSYPYHRNAPYIMVGCAPNEMHEIGALMMAVLLRSEGFRVEFLGPDIPLDDLVDHARYEKPQMVILTATTRETALEMKRLKEKLSRLRPVPVFGYGGSAFNLEPDLLTQVPGIFLGKSLDDAVETVKDLLKPEKRTGQAKKIRVAG